ncbi:MAG: hypothetical protein N2327_04150, partial [Caldimicrobium sp.]|nr:hypothetical protein [Caldimicrobium sp.]
KEFAFRLKGSEFRNSIGTKAHRLTKGEMLKEVANEVIAFILSYRREPFRIGKEKLKPLVDRFCRERGIALVSVSTIGRIIRYLKERGLLRGEEVKKLSYYGKTGRFIEREKRRRRSWRKSKRYRGGRRRLQPGDLVQMDAIVYFLDGIRRYVLVANDVASRFGFAFEEQSFIE